MVLESKNIVYFSPTEDSENKEAVSPEKKDYEDFVKKQCLPKNMRKVNMALFELNTRRNMMNLSSKMVHEMPANKKKVIDMKYDLKKIKDKLVNERTQVIDLLKKSGIEEKRKKYGKCKRIFSFDDVSQTDLDDLKSDKGNV